MAYNKWHLVKNEAFPEDCKRVLVDYEYFRYGDYNCMFRTIGIGYCYNNRWNIEGGGHDINVFAWMELPEFSEVKE